MLLETTTRVTGLFAIDFQAEQSEIFEAHWKLINVR